MSVARLPDPIPTVGDAEIDALLDEALRGSPKKREHALRRVRYRIEGLLADAQSGRTAGATLEAAAGGADVLARLRDEADAAAESRYARQAEIEAEARERRIPALEAALDGLVPAEGFNRGRWASRGPTRREIAEALSRSDEDVIEAWRESVTIAETAEAERLEKEHEVEREEQERLDAARDRIIEDAEQLAAGTLAMIGLSHRDGDRLPVLDMRDAALRVLGDSLHRVDLWRGRWRDGR